MKTNNETPKEKNKRICFVSVGDPKRQGKAYYEKVLVTRAKGETVEAAAERFRINVANELNKTRTDTPFYLPSELYYLVFTNYSDKIPAISSINAKQKVLVLRVKNEYSASR